MMNNFNPWAQGSRIKAIVGHYGSGKTEIALAMALDAKSQGFQSCIVDLDIVNPFFRSAAHEKAWLLRTAINLCKDFKKSAAYRSNTSLDESTTAELSPETTEVLEVVNRLPETDRYAVYLFYFERMSIREIAYALNEKEGTVSARLSRARKKLKTLLKGEGYESL